VTMRPTTRRAAGIACVLLAGPAVAAAALADQPRFASPDAALAALTSALEREDGDALADLLGPEHRADLVGGDPAQARQWMDELNALVRQGARLDPNADGSVTVVLGRRDWPMPVPLVQEARGWRFDTEAGLEAIDDRRVGGNELTAIGLLRAYADAQLAYAQADRDGDRVLEYAQKIVSTPGQRDGLYWEATGDAELSPLGPLVAEADAYAKEYHQRGEPYHGYYFKVLTRQGANPPGGAYDYVINGNMIAGFAMVAWPADYGHTGVMTFAVSHQGTVYETDLGDDTETLAPRIAAYDPGQGWEEVGAEEAPP
jgi:Protein of unknown function (DUF2950)